MRLMIGRRAPALGLLFAIAMTMLFIAAACGDDDDDGDGDGAGELTATLSEIDGSGVTGTAILTEDDDGTTRVVVSMEGLPEGPHANHIHHVTCDAQGEVHLTLEELQAGADGAAEATTTDFPEEDPDRALAYFEVGHYIAVHVGGNDTVGAVISCGNIE